MTTCDDVTAAPCSCESCTADLPVNPFLALRVAYGMLLGEDDFRAMMGNPRGKHMLHGAWQHGSGVVWGYDVEVCGEREITVSPGLAVDGLGRELLLETTRTKDVREWLTEQNLTAEQCQTTTVRACLVARFGCSLTAPVPTLADPCDVTRKHDDFSRIVETAEIELVQPQECPCPPRGYHRVRVLLGLDKVDTCDTADQDARKAIELVAQAAPDDRPRELLRQFRQLAACDAADLKPAHEEGDAFPTLFPVTEDNAAVVLACIEIDIQEKNGCTEITRMCLDASCRTALLPTATIQDLLCGLAPALISAASEHDACGPRVVPDSRRWGELPGAEGDCANGWELTFTLTAAPNVCTLSRAIRLTSLSEGGWVNENLGSVSYSASPDEHTVSVRLASPPRNNLVRLIVKGTGPTPLMGVDPPVPLAGVKGGPPGTKNDGHDAVFTFSLNENRGTTS